MTANKPNPCATVTNKACFLDVRLERVTDMAYTDNPRRYVRLPD